MQRDDAGQLNIDPEYYGRRETFEALQVIFASTSERFKTGMTSGRPQFNTATGVSHDEANLAVSRRYGASDFVGFLAPTGTGHVLIVGTPVELPPAIPPARLAAMGACAAHLAASWRLRRRLLADDRWEHRAEAVAHPDGRIVHAEGEARAPGALAALRRMVRARERARTGPRADAEPLWPELVAGRWTLVDCFDHAARRYVVAWRNPPDATRTPLSPRAREVLARTARGESSKVIAAALGATEAAVSMALHAAMKALRIERVSDVIRLGAGVSTEAVFRDEGLTAVALAPGARVDLGALTAAEREVLAELLRGASNDAIAAQRNRSARTVANQVASVFAKLGVDSRRALQAKLAGR
jgi:DNA-binding CsgD family transcriptional regulator